MWALWLVNQVWFIVPLNTWENRAPSELLYKSNRVVVVYCLIIDYFLLKHYVITNKRKSVTSGGLNNISWSHYRETQCRIDLIPISICIKLSHRTFKFEFNLEDFFCSSQAET